jgi:hypothetical protein
MSWDVLPNVVVVVSVVQGSTLGSHVMSFATAARVVRTVVLGVRGEV